MTGTYVAVPRVYVLGKKYGELGLGFIGLPGVAVGGGGGVGGVGPMPHTARLPTAHAAHNSILHLEWFILAPILKCQIRQNVEIIIQNFKQFTNY